MRIFCRGFNLYNQLNLPNKCLVEFQCTNETDSVDFFQSQHTFSVIVSNNIVKVQCNYLEQNVVNNKAIQDILCLATSENAILIVNGLGNAYKISPDNLDLVNVLPKFVNRDDSIKILCCGSKLNMAYTQNGFLYSIPEKLDFQNNNIVDITVGREHCLLLDSLGCVYTFGRGSRGQLGLGDLDDVYHPKLVEALAGIEVVKIAAGGWHSAVITKDGDVYTWGWNGNGQLGLASVSNQEAVSVMARPHVIDISNCLENKALKIACGNRHTVVLLDNNNLYGCGWNKYKQLINQNTNNYYEFVCIHDFSNECVDKIVCGPWSTSVLCK